MKKIIIHLRNNPIDIVISILFAIWISLMILWIITSIFYRYNTYNGSISSFLIIIYLLVSFLYSMYFLINKDKYIKKLDNNIIKFNELEYKNQNEYININIGLNIETLSFLFYNPLKMFFYYFKIYFIISLFLLFVFSTSLSIYILYFIQQKNSLL